MNTPRILPVVTLSHALTHIALMVYPATLLWIGQEFAASNTELASAYTVRLFFGLTALPAGWLVTRLGAPRVLAAGFALAALAAALAGCSPTLSTLTLALLLLNAALGVYHPAANTLISHYAVRRGHALGLHGTFGSIGEFLGPVVSVLIAQWWFGWRAPFVVLAVPALGLTGAYLWLARTLPAEPTAEKHPPGFQGSFFNRSLLLLFGVLLLNGFLYYTMILFLPAFLAQAGPNYAWLATGESEGLKGGVLAGLVLGLGGVGQWVSGRLSDRGNQPVLLTLFYLLAALTLAGMALSSGVALLVWCLLLSFTYFMVQPVTNALVARYSSAEHRGWAFSLAFALQFGPGAFGQPLGGWLADTYSLHTVYAACAAWALCIALVAASLAWQTRHEPAGPRQNRA